LIKNVKLYQQIPGWADKDIVAAGETAAKEKVELKTLIRCWLIPIAIGKDAGM